MKTILVPLDGSEIAEQALPLASAIAEAYEAEVMVATALTAGDRWVDDQHVARFEEAASKAAAAYLLGIVSKLERLGIPGREKVVWGKPSSVVSQIVSDEGVDLIVMTTHGRSGLSRLTMGSVASQLIRTTDIPIVVVRPTADELVATGITKIVVPLDGSDLAEEALPHAEHLARVMNASLLLVQAVVPTTTLYPDELIPGDLPVLDSKEAQALQYLEEVAGKLRKRDFDVTVAAAVGVPADVVLELARANGADFVVMTSHGRSGVNRFVLGSVADEVLHRGEIPVLMIRLTEVIPEEENLQSRIPAIGNSVVPLPTFTESELAEPVGAPPKAEPRPHRPEREPGR